MFVPTSPIPIMLSGTRLARLRVVSSAAQAGSHQGRSVCSPSGDTAAARASPPVAIDPDDPSCGLPESRAHFTEVAHAGYMHGVARVGNRVITQDKKRWVLWNVETRKAVASGPVHVDFRNVDLAGKVALTPSEDGRGLEVRSADDGHVTGRVVLDDPSTGTRMLASDGSYVSVGTGRSLRMFDLTGRVLFERRGDYSRIAVYTTPTEFRVAQSASPSVETFNLAGERLHASSFPGFFSAWFVDGSHYTTSSSDGVRVFTAVGEFVRFFPNRAALPSDRARVGTAGDGGLVWIQEAFELYRVHGRRIDDGSFVDSFDGSLVDGANLSRVMFADPRTETIGELTIFEVEAKSRYPRLRRVPAADYVGGRFSVDTAGNWASVGNRGEVYGSKTDASIPPLALGCGRPLAIAGARDRVAVLTSDGRIAVFDLVNGQHHWLRTIDVLQDSYSADLSLRPTAAISSCTVNCAATSSRGRPSTCSISRCCSPASRPRPWCSATEQTPMAWDSSQRRTANTSRLAPALAARPQAPRPPARST